MDRVTSLKSLGYRYKYKFLSFVSTKELKKLCFLIGSNGVEKHRTKIAEFNERER